VRRLMLFLLGRPRIERDGAPIEMDTRKAIGLIAYIAVTHQHHARADLAALLWPECNQARGYANLRRTIAGLNKALGGDYLSVDQELVGLNPVADLWLDVDQFIAALAASRAHDHLATEVCATCLEVLTKAIELYRDDFMYGFTLGDNPNFDQWRLFQAQRLRQEVAGTLERLVYGYSAQGQFKAAIPYALRWLALDTYHEPAHRALMQLYAWTGEHSAALRHLHQYQERVQALEQGAGGAPQAAPALLYQAMRAKQSPTGDHERFGAAGTGPPAPAAHDGTPAAGPDSTQSLHHLIQSGPFVGRAEELDQIAALLGDPPCRLLTLTGPGGIGKTRLAVQAAFEQRGAFEHGIYFVSCATVNSTTLLLSALADALHFSFYAAGEPKQQLLDFLRSKNLLLLIDSAEHLAGAVELLTEILGEAYAVKILATSIERLNVHEEWALDIQGLHYPEDEKAPYLEAYSAVQFFLQSARRVQAGFVPSDQDKQWIARICRLVAGIPLGIELAASWLRVLPCREILREVENNLDFLATSVRNVPERHRSLRAVFEHSWNLLYESEQHVLERLAIFQAGCRREAAERVAAATLPLLLGLVDKSLLHRNTSGRYEMLGVIRTYAQEKLSVAARAETRLLFCSYYADFLRRCEEMIKQGRQQEALTEIRQELENIHAGWLWAVEHGLRQEILCFASNLYLFFEIQGRFQEGEERFSEVTECFGTRYSDEDAQDEADRFLMAQLRAYQGGFCYRLGRNDQAVRLLQESLVVFRAHAALEGIAFCLACLGDIARIKGHYPEARAALEESLAICAQVGDRGIAARAYTNLGVVAGASGAYCEARRLFDASLGIFQALGDRSGEARALINLGIVSYYMHNYAEAQKLLQASLDTSRVIGNRFSIAVALDNLGIIAYELGQYAEAKQLYLESRAICQQLGLRLGEGVALNDLGQVALALGEAVEACGYFDAALRIAMDIQATPLALNVLVGIAALLERSEPERGLELLLLASEHPASDHETRDRAMASLARLTAQTPGDIAVGTNRPTQTFEEVVAQLLANQPHM
jgi:predicted ATPase/DNA-binding SARP family transcriptional activator/Tfp pilus assembly protein PilF